MSKGLSLASLSLKDVSRFKVNFNTVFNISGASGLTVLCNDYLFFLLSTYDPVKKTGSRIIEFLAAPIVYNVDQGLTVVNIIDEINDTTARFKVFQSESFTPTPNEELLDTVNILAVEVDPEKGEINPDIEIINVLGQKARLLV